MELWLYYINFMECLYICIYKFGVYIIIWIDMNMNYMFL